MSFLVFFHAGILPMCIFQSTCNVGERFDYHSCTCVPESAKCAPRECPLHKLSPRCIVYKKDSNGCQICDCECDELKQICPVNCPNGTEIITRPNGCKECKCRDNICGLTQCDNICPYGRVKDNNGCQTCSCKPRRHVCPPVMCGEMCPYGTFDDTNSCPTCVCKPKPVCPVLSCDNFCPSGRELYSNGCDKCICKPIRRTEGKRCPQLACSKRCLNGKELDRNGCPTCTCKTTLLWRKITSIDQVL